MSITINSENILKNNLLIRNDYIASYKHLERPKNLETTFSGGAIFTGNWRKNSWYCYGIQITNQKFEQKMLELRKPIMDEMWFAIILMHITNWEHNQSKISSNSVKYLRIELKETINFIKEQNWSFSALDEKYIQHVNEEYIFIHKELIELFFKELNSQEKFLKEYAYKEFIKKNDSNDYLWIPGEVTKTILNKLENKENIRLKNESIYISFNKKERELLFEFEFKNYIENFVTNIEGITFYKLSNNLFNDLERFLGLNKNNKLTQEDIDSIVDNMPLLIELKKESKNLSKKDKSQLMKTQKELLIKWCLPESFNEFRNYLLDTAINQIIKSKSIYSMKEKEDNLFKLGKNDIGLNVFIENENKLKHIASNDESFSKKFRNHFNVLPIEEYSTKYENNNQKKNYIYFEVKNYKDLTKENKSIILKILIQGRAFRNFIWFNIPKEEMKEFKNTIYMWNIMSLYSDKDSQEEMLEYVHPQLKKVIKNIFVSQSENINEFLI